MIQWYQPAGRAQQGQNQQGQNQQGQDLQGQDQQGQNQQAEGPAGFTTGGRNFFIIDLQTFISSVSSNKRQIKRIGLEQTGESSANQNVSFSAS